MSRDGSATGSTPPVIDQGWRCTARTILHRFGGVSGTAVAALPTIVFVAANTIISLAPALIATAITAVLIFAWRIARREPLHAALTGLVIAGMCIACTIYIGQAKGFFLLSILVNAAVVVACAASVLARRPLAGILLNRIVGGGRDWREHHRLRRIYAGTTLLPATASLVSFVLQAALYQANQTAWLAALHVAAVPTWIAITIAIVVLARWAITRDRERAR